MRPSCFPTPLGSRIGSARLAVALLFASATVGAVAAGATITQPWWAITGGGGIGSSGGAYGLSGAAGPVATTLAGGSYSMTGGFWAAPQGGGTTAVPPPVVPRAFSFAPPSPNPFIASTALALVLPGRERVRAAIFDVRGECVRTLVDAVRDAGEYREIWDGRTDANQIASPGVYFVRVRAGAFDVTRRVVRLR